MSKTKMGLGLAALGRPDYINIRTDKAVDKSIEAFELNAHEMLDFAYTKGIKYFDTAPSYGYGERFLIDWNNKNKLSDINLSTKWGYTYVANWEVGHTGTHEVKEHSLEKLIQQWDVSKVLLPNLKIYQVHSATFESGILSSQSVINHLFEIKNQTGLKIGLTTSGTNQAEVIKAALAIEIDGKPLFDSFQVTFNILEQTTFSVLEEILAKGKTVIVKEALANGRIFSNQNENHIYLKRLAIKYNAGIDAIALRFVMQYLHPTYVLSGASSKEQLEQNLKATGFELTKLEIEKMSQLSSDPTTYWNDRKALEWS